MSGVIRVTQGDNATVNLVLIDKKTGLEVDVSTSNIFLNFRKAGKPPTLTAISCTRLPGKVLPDGSILMDAPYNTAGKGGRCSATFPDGALMVPPGNYEGQVKVVTSSGAVVTAFDPVHFTVGPSF